MDSLAGRGAADSPQDDLLDSVATESVTGHTDLSHLGQASDIISVIIPCYKQAEFLAEAIESVLAQTYPHHEIIVVDDGSPDQTAAVAQRYPSVRYVHQENRGLPAARNTGVQRSTGEFLVFLDADDRLTPDHFARSLAAFQQHPNASAVCGDWRWFGLDAMPHVHNCDRLPDYYGSLLRRTFLIPIHTVMLRRAVYVALGGFREHLRVWEDVDFFLRLTRRYTMHCHHAVIAEYRRHSGQTIRQCDVMLKGTMAVYQGERHYIRRHPEYAAAYESGRQNIWEVYGEQVFWHMLSATKEGHIGLALRYGTLLARCYPRETAGMLFQTLLRSLNQLLGVTSKPSV